MHALFAVFLASVVFICTANALQCNTSYTWYRWASNSNGQDPCQIVSDLHNSCAPNVVPFQPLTYIPSGINFYPGPNSSVQSACTCSYVMYNLLTACGDCQVGFLAPTAWPTYKDWAQSCDEVNTGGIYPNAVPNGLVGAIPLWARFSTKESGDPRWSYGLSHAVSIGHFLVNSNVVDAAPPSSSCTSPSPALPIGTAFTGFVVGLFVSIFAFLFQRRRRARVIPPPTRYHTAPDNTPLHPLVPRSAQSQGTSFLRRMLEHEQENDPRRIEPFDLPAAVGSFPPHPAAFPAMRGQHTFPPTLSIGAQSPGPSRQPSLASLSPSAFHPVPLRHSRSQSHNKSSSRPQTAASQFSVSGSAVPGPSLMPLQSISPSEPPSPVPLDHTWPEAAEDPPAYRRKT